MISPGKAHGPPFLVPKLLKPSVDDLDDRDGIIRASLVCGSEMISILVRCNGAFLGDAETSDGVNPIHLESQE